MPSLIKKLTLIRRWVTTYLLSRKNTYVYVPIQTLDYIKFNNASKIKDELRNFKVRSMI